MIRTATRSDLSALTELLTEFLSEGSYTEHLEDLDPDHLRSLVYVILQQGYIWLLCHDHVIVGCLIAVKEPNIWIPSKVSLRELVWYVKEPYRRTPGAGRLFVKFCQLGDQLKASGEIAGYFTSQMASTDYLDLESRGFRLTERLYLKD